VGVGALDDVDLYYRFFYQTSLASRPARPAAEPPADAHRDDDPVLAFVEEYLPYYTEFSVEMRELLHRQADDGSWASARLPPHGLALTVPGSTPGTELEVRSVLPTWRCLLSETGRDGAGSTTAAGVTLLAAAPFLVAGFVGLAYAIVAFVLRNVFLAQLTEPLWATGRLAATSGDNLFVLCDTPLMEAQIRGASALRLGPIVASAAPEAEWRRALLRIDRADGGRAILVSDLDTETEDLDVLRRKLLLLAELVENPARTVVVLSQTPLSTLNDAVCRDACAGGPDPARWQRAQQAFIVLDWRDAPSEVPPLDVTLEEPLPAGWRGWAARLSPRRWRRSTRRTSEWLLAREGRPSPTLRRICDDIRASQAHQAGTLTCEQVLDEIEERALGYYRRVWNACSGEEKIVLTHVARQGLANAASRRVVRRLLVRGLLFKDPGLRLMNDTFARFVRSSVCRTEAARLEGEAEPSTWDRLRVPIGVAAGSAGIFLYLTQRETFDATLSVIGGVTAAIPIVFRTVSLITDRRAVAGDEGRA
jgi:hypothetical protein